MSKIRSRCTKCGTKTTRVTVDHVRSVAGRRFAYGTCRDEWTCEQRERRNRIRRNRHNAHVEIMRQRKAKRQLPALSARRHVG